MQTSPSLHRDLLDLSTFAGPLAYAVVVLAGAEVGRRALRSTVGRLLARDVHGLVDRTAVSFLLQLAEIAVFVAALIVYAHLVPALHRVGTALLAGVSVASVVFALAAQNTLGNLVSGLSLLLYRPFRVDDFVQVGTPAGPLAGVVKHLNLGYTLLSTEDGREVMVPNSVMASQVAVNLNGRGLRALAQVAFTIPAADAVLRAQGALVAVARAQPGVVGVVGCPMLPIGRDHVAATLRAWCADEPAARRAEAAFRREGAKALAACGIVVSTVGPAGSTGA